jgi:hypothetical protein
MTKPCETKVAGSYRTRENTGMDKNFGRETQQNPVIKLHSINCLKFKTARSF